MILLAMLATVVGYAAGVAYMLYVSKRDYGGQPHEHGIAVVLSFLWPIILFTELKRKFFK
jgi:hypothetical protein